MSETTVPTPPKFDPDQLYRVTVSRVVSVGPLRITPKNGGTIIGSEAEKIRDAIVTSEIFQPAE